MITLLHVDRTVMLEMIGPPLLVLGAASLLTWIVVAQWRLTAAIGAALAGALLLVTGMTGDLVGHASAHDGEASLPMMVMMHPRAAADISTHEQVVEARNRWHLVAAAGQGMLVTGLATGFVLLYRARR